MSLCNANTPHKHPTTHHWTQSTEFFRNSDTNLKHLRLGKKISEGSSVYEFSFSYSKQDNDHLLPWWHSDIWVLILAHHWSVLRCSIFPLIYASGSLLTLSPANYPRIFELRLQPQKYQVSKTSFCGSLLSFLIKPVVLAVLFFLVRVSRGSVKKSEPDPARMIDYWKLIT